MTKADRLVEEYERLRERADNLNLYLSYVERFAPDTFGAMQDEFSGMPGYEAEPSYTPEYMEEDDG